MIINARSGQTGFWIAAIQGAFLLAVLHRRRTAGLWLGLLALKPHLGVGLGVAALVQRQVRTLCLAAGAAAALGVAATLALGPAIWPTFLGGMHQASAMLLDRQFPLARMTSVFAFFAPAGLAPWQAMALHLCVLALALALVVYTHGREWPAHLFWASATFAGLLVSPYAYDYDLVILALIGGLILPDLCQEAGSVVLAVLLALCWLAAANLQLTSAQILYLGYIAEYHGKAVLISMSAPFLLAAAALCGFVLFRHRSLGRQLRAVRPRTIKRAGGDGR